MDTNPTNRRASKVPRVPDNPMTLLAGKVLKAATDAAGSADELCSQMEPYLLRLYTNGSIYGYTNGHHVPPGDVLLAAIIATGISLDDMLGIGRQPSEMERQMNELRAEMARLRGDVTDLQGGIERAPTADEARAQRDAERRERARRSPAAEPTTATTTTGRPARRTRGI